MVKNIFDISTLMVLGFTPIVTGSLVSVFTLRKQDRNWYEKLNKPNYIPSSMVFRIIWPVLYLCFGMAMMLYLWGTPVTAWGHGAALISLVIFVVNLLSNLSFTLFQFRLKCLFCSMVVCYVTLLTAVALVYLFFMYPLHLVRNYQKAKYAALFMLPYVCWMILACIMSTHVFVLNSDKINKS